MTQIMRNLPFEQIESFRLETIGVIPSVFSARDGGPRWGGPWRKAPPRQASQGLGQTGRFTPKCSGGDLAKRNEATVRD